MRYTTPILALATLFVSCRNDKSDLPAEQAQEKLATFHLFAQQEYAGSPMENTTAEVRLQLRIINYKTGEQQLVWDSLLPVRKIMDFPRYDQKLVIIKKQPVHNSHQKLNASMSVIYRDAQMISQEGRSDEAGPGTNSILLEAAL